MVKNQKCKSWVLNVFLNFLFLHSLIKYLEPSFSDLAHPLIRFLNFLFLHSLIKYLEPSFSNLAHPLIRYPVFVICLVFIIKDKGKAVPVQAY